MTHWRAQFNEVRHISCRLRGGPKKQFWIYRDGRGVLHNSATGQEWYPHIFTDIRDIETGEKLDATQLSKVPDQYRETAERAAREAAECFRK